MNPAFSVRSRSADQTRALGRALGERLRGGDVVGLSGPLGAGKTCFVQGLARGVGVPDSAAVTSPTFVLVAEYPGRLWLRHADFYRVESYARLLDAGFDDLAAPDGVLVVEWPERFPEALPADRLELRIAADAVSGEREIGIEARGERARELLKELESSWR
ncbi:MAG TPA: tRNA (adenosine(37)-N6)-threonylcarbamoyltransferase complex ATPase subunit type 1 TsaE [Myxococcota bacterium]|nr:tRNA (adenosine(37)-N6)-threonylcarbamoyltransferase complex ATPase subunit type 1 TsaE [Myxococcota bacterium]